VSFTALEKGGFMNIHTVLAEAIVILTFAVGVHAAESFSVPGTGAVTAVIGAQLFEHRSTPAILEPNNFIAVCFATNLDSSNRDLAAQIIDSTGADITETSSCGVRQGPGVTCRSTAHFRNNSALRCVVSTSGTATNLRGGMTTSAGPFPFTSPANLTIAAE
jgi:hypothetical protein